MKTSKLFSILIAFIVSALFVSCDKNDPQPQPLPEPGDSIVVVDTNGPIEYGEFIIEPFEVIDTREYEHVDTSYDVFDDGRFSEDSYDINYSSSSGDNQKGITYIYDTLVEIWINSITFTVTYPDGSTKTFEDAYCSYRCYHSSYDSWLRNEEDQYYYIYAETNTSTIVSATDFDGFHRVWELDNANYDIIGYWENSEKIEISTESDTLDVIDAFYYVVDER